MSTARLVRLCVLVYSLFFLKSIAAQENQITPNNQTGIAPYNTYSGDHENVNLASGNVNFQIPLLTLLGRNHHDLTVNLSYDSHQWQLASLVDPNFGFEGYYWTGIPGSGWHLNYPAFISRTQHCDPIGSDYNVYWGDFVVQLPTGERYHFGNTKGSVYHQGACDGDPTGGGQPDFTPDESTDGSWLQFDTSDPNNAVLRFEDGSSMIFYGYMSGGTQVDWKDSNGNIITYYNCNALHDY